MADKLTKLIGGAYRDVQEAQAIAHPAGLRDVLEKLYIAGKALREARELDRKR